MRIKFLKFEYEVTDKEIDKMFNEYVKNGGLEKYDKYVNQLPTSVFKDNLDLIFNYFINHLIYTSSFSVIACILIRSFLLSYQIGSANILLFLVDIILVISTILFFGYVLGWLLYFIVSFIFFIPSIFKKIKVLFHK